MSRIAALKVFLCLALLWGSAARADYEAGQAAWKAGRHSEALTEWRAAAGTDDSRAMLALGRVFVKGLGVPQDYVLAHKWLNLAAGRGDVEAAAEREALAAKMTPQQIASAQEQARAWRSSGKAAAPKAAAGPKTTATSPPTIPPPARAIREAQGLMGDLGYKPGPADGAWGPRTERAYAAFLSDAGLPPGKVLTLEALRAMRGITGKEKAPSAIASAGPEASKGKVPSTKAGRGAMVAGSTRSATTPAANCEGWNTEAFFREATPERVAECLRAGADLNDRSEYGSTPLHLAAAFTNNPAVVTALTKAGADPNALTGYDRTPLHMAAQHEKPAGAAALLKAGADPNARDKAGELPLHLAASSNATPAVVTALLKAGSDPNAPNKDGKIPVDMAHKNKNPAVLTALKEAASESKAASTRAGLVFCPPAEHREPMSGLAIPFSMWQCAGHGDAAGPGFVR